MYRFIRCTPATALPSAVWWSLIACLFIAFPKYCKSGGNFNLLSGQLGDTAGSPAASQLQGLILSLILSLIQVIVPFPKNSPVGGLCMCVYQECNALSVSSTLLW